MASVDDILAIARGELGTYGGSKYWYHVYGWSGGGADWCAVFDSYLASRAGVPVNYFPSKFAFDRRDRGAIGSQWVDKNDLRAGDFIAMDFDGKKGGVFDGDFGGDHVGIVEERLSGSVYRCIEGNVSNRVQRRDRHVSCVIAGIRPAYSAGGSFVERLLVDGVFGPLTCKRLQSAMQADGFYAGYLLDGDFGWYTQRELQRYLQWKGYYKGYLLDGDFGYHSAYALQAYLRDLGYFGKSWNHDGIFGKWTTVALQNALNDRRF